jgi:glycosyltransferase involved in cell wall biosynthesis
MRKASLHVALVAPLWHPIVPDRGGIEQIIFLLARELLAQGHEVTLIASGDSAPLGRLVAVCPEALVTAMAKGESEEYSYYESVAISETLRLAGEVDVVHSHLNGAFVPFAPLLSVPVLHTQHIEITKDLRWLVHRFPHTHLTTVSHWQAAALAWNGDVTVVANGVDMAAFPFCAEPDEYLLFLGRLHPEKGPRIAIEVAKALRQPLVLAGSIVDPVFFKQQIEPELDGRLVQYVGPVEGAEKVRLLQRAKGLLFPVLWEETFGLVMVEAMACGTPVVALRKGAVPEIITPGVNGFYGEHPADLPPLVECLGEVARAAVRQSVCERFSHSQMVQQYLALYHRLLRG